MQYPAIYRIRISGHLDTNWSDRLAGMTVTATGENNIQDITILEGRLADQAALSGVLNILYDLQFSLVSVEYLDCTNSGKEGESI